MASQLFFVAGITGRVGGAAARQLLAQGHKVRSLARDPAKAAAWADQGVDVRQGDWNDTAALTQALNGVDGAYVMMPPIFVPSPDYAEARAVTASLQTALSTSKPPRVVALSSFGSEQPTGLGLITSTYLMEQGLQTLDLPIAYVRAGGFFDNNLASLPGIASTGIFHCFSELTNRPSLSIATPDIGAEVARLLTGPAWQGTRIIELGSLISPDELAAGMAEALGRDVKAEAVPRDRWTATLTSFGFPAGATGLYEEMMDAINSGWIHSGNSGTEPVPATLTPAEFYSQARLSAHSS